MPDLYTVFGNPVDHSQSPWIHARFAEQTGQEIRYEREEVPLDGFTAALANFRRRGGRGLNVTVPFKQEAWHAVDRRSPRAEHAGAVNTISLREDGSSDGDNTDGVGLVRDLCRNHRIRIGGQRVLILGAGGAVRGILWPLVEEAPLELVIANRTLARAEGLLPLCHGVRRRAVGYEDLAKEPPFHLIINGTSAGLHGSMPALPDGLLAENGTVQEMAYGKGATVFTEWARRQGAATVVDGLGMLVEQAAESFSIWRGVRPDTAPVIAALRQRLA